MPRKRIDQIDGRQTMFATTSLLMQYCFDLTNSLPDDERVIVLDYLRLRDSGTWNKSQIADLLTLARYEVGCSKLSKQLSNVVNEDILEVKELKAIHSLLSSLQNQAYLLRQQLGLTLNALHGDQRERRDADRAQSAVIDILTAKPPEADTLTDLDIARQRSKERLLKLANSGD